ncbi:prolipoprotein diacylglyceryl transferase [Balneatrix alpica]|uniref:Phosphatidylglycerol--prolipoprotein diacylglyceryl transferase n=1 Tax=Balneatrix alpica TaxID=75684 RepID=A0ABV5ZC44_9GAMM|nr:prolipoprotein diacylglyceryl transferase [Balneatrix alpica]
MLTYPQIDPVALQLGPLKIHWYGLMYLLGFAAAWWLGRRRMGRFGMNGEQLSDLIFACALGVVVGGRVGYVLFYHLDRFFQDPLWLFAVWEGGMSFHGGLLGVLLALVWQARKLNLRFLQLGDFIAPLVPIGLGAGRIGNFIGGELWGRPTDGPWAMVFPHVDLLPRHPSQLYQFALEGLALFVVLWLYSSKPRATGAVSGLFLIGYGLARFVVEFARQPDAHLGFIAFEWLTMGQLLSLPMIIAGLWLMALSRKSESRN